MQTVLVPGLLCSPRLYAPVLPAVWASGPVTIADTLHDDTIPGMARRLLDGVSGPFALAGLSMGGYVALEVVRQAPERVAALALLSTSARPDTPEQTASRREQAELARAGRFDEVVAGAFGATVAEANEDDETLHATFRAMCDDVGPDVYVRQLGAVVDRADSRPLLPSITAPALVLHGEGDRLIDPENGRELAAGIPGARLELLEACGHSPTLERPDATGAALAGLLSAL